MRGELISGDPTATWEGAAIDSRALAGGELFFALPGERTDGHLFVADALAAGAAAAIVDDRPLEAPSGAVARVDDPYEALHRLTRTIRDRVPEHLVGVTGSSGKTTTKELLAAMLSRRYRTAASPGNLNNLLGFPLALLGIPDDTEWMVAEMGMSTPGELRRVSLLGRPDVAVFTNVRQAHLEFFGSVERIAAAKAELLAGLGRDGVVVANGDDPNVRWIASRHAGEVVFYGRRGGDVRAVDVESLRDGVGSRFRLVADAGEVEVVLPLHGTYNVDNCLAAAACALRLGVDVPEVAAAVTGLASQPGRGVVHRLDNGAVVVDDSYNSNPDAARRALESAAAVGAGRRWAVLGDMLELGEAGPELHRSVGARAVELGFAPVLGVGELSRHLVEEAAAVGADARWLADAGEAAAAAVVELRPGDVVLVKGSRGVGLEAVVEALLAAGGGRDA